MKTYLHKWGLLVGEDYDGIIGGRYALFTSAGYFRHRVNEEFFRRHKDEVLKVDITLPLEDEIRNVLGASYSHAIHVNLELNGDWRLTEVDFDSVAAAWEDLVLINEDWEDPKFTAAEGPLTIRSLSGLLLAELPREHWEGVDEFYDYLTFIISDLHNVEPFPFNVPGWEILSEPIRKEITSLLLKGERPTEALRLLANRYPTLKSLLHSKNSHNNG